MRFRSTVSQLCGVGRSQKTKLRKSKDSVWGREIGGGMVDNLGEGLLGLSH